MKKMGLAILCSTFFFACSGDDGKNGVDGLNGADGLDGADGESCWATPLDDESGFAVYCGDDFVGYLHNGENGADGKDGLDGAKGEVGPAGTNGKDGESCVTEKMDLSSDFVVICGGKLVGYLHNGVDGGKGDKGDKGDVGATGPAGTNGKDGVNGQNGEDGKSCVMRDTTDANNAKRTGVIISCGAVTQTLWGASFEEIISSSSSKEQEAVSSDSQDGTSSSSQENLSSEGQGEASSSSNDAASSSSSSVFDELPTCDEEYDASTQICLDGYVYNMCGTRKSYDPRTEFCYAAADSVLALCEGKSYDITTHFCEEDSIYVLCEGKQKYSKEKFCYNDILYFRCGDKTFDPSTQYCIDGVVKKGRDGYMRDARDGRLYKTVWINGQNWMAENLNYAPGDVSSMGSNAWHGCYNNDENNCATYGRLYTWEVAMNNADCADGNSCSPSGVQQGVCPEGWHLPSAEEFNALLSYANGHIRSWKSDDVFGFSLLPAGFRTYNGNFTNQGRDGYLWSSSESNIYYAYYVNCPGMYISSKLSAMSVRCLQDSN